MSQFGYALAQGGAAAAASGVNSMDRQLKEESDMRAADRRLSDAERLRAIEESFTIRAEERKRQIALRQGRDIETGATGLLASEDAGAINASLGSNIDPKNPDSAATLAAIRANPAAAQAYGLQDDTDIAKSKRRATAARNIGDLAAAREEDVNSRTLVGEKTAKEKGEREDKRLDILEKAADARDKRESAFREATLAHQSRMEKSADARATAADAAATRNAIGTLLTGVNSDIKNLEKENASLDTDPGKKAVIEKQLASLRSESERYRAFLGEKAGVPAAPPAPAAALEKPNDAANAKLLANLSNAKAVADYKARFGAEAFDAATKKAAPAEAPAKPTGPTGMLASDYTPPPESPAGMLASRVNDTRKAAQEKQQQLTTEAQTLAQKAIESRDPVAAQAAQDAPGFGMLPQATRARIFAIVRGG